MKEMLFINYRHSDFKDHLNDYAKKVKEIDTIIKNKSGRGNDYLGWFDYTDHLNKEEIEQIKKDAKYVRDNFEVLVVCGIGGSYLGARAAIEALGGLNKKDKLEIIFLGNTFSPTYTYQILDYLKDKKFAINVVSKSGTTTETAIAFRLLRNLLIEKIGKENAKKAIYATTDKEKGILKELCDKEGYQRYILPDDIGGRYSVFTPVGLFPLACAGYNIDVFLLGCKRGYYDFDDDELLENKAYQYACFRDYMYKNKGKSVELFVQYEPHLCQLNEWLKQLFAESEGKEHKGLFPASVNFSTDLHSLGQFIQEGSPILFETIFKANTSLHDVTIPHDEEDFDQLNYLENKTLNYVNEMAFEGTLKAHAEQGNVPCMVIYLEKVDEYSLGYLMYFFMKACAMSAYLLDINPFNQPGVEIYKKNMLHLLGKKGY